MESLLALGSILPPLVLLGLALKLHRKAKLPKLLLTGIILVPLALVPQVSMMALGPQRTQALLLELFPEANDPHKDPSSTIQVEEVEVGPVYMAVMQLSYLPPSLALFLFGLGFFLFGKHAVREQQQSIMTQTNVR